MSGRRLILPMSVVTGDLSTAIAEIKQRYDGDIAIHSSATLMQSLVETKPSGERTFLMHLPGSK